MESLQFTCCKLCSSIYKDARILPCLHSFCYACIRKYLAKEYNEENRVNCPNCRDRSILPADGVDGLPRNTVLMRYLYVQGLELSPSRRKLSSASSECEGISKKDAAKKLDTITVIPIEKIQPPTNNEQVNEASQKTDLFHQFATVTSGDSETEESTEFDSNASTRASSLSDISSITASEFSYVNVRRFEPDTMETQTDRAYKQRTDTLQPDSVTTEKGPRARMQLARSVLQEEALNIVNGIANVNEIATDWLKHKAKLKSNIRQRAQQLKEILVLWEKKMVSHLDNFRTESEFQQEVKRVKGELHTYLGDMLNVSESIRILLQYGTNDEMEEYDELIKNKINKLSEQKASMKPKKFVFDYPKQSLTEPIEESFGILTTKEQPVFEWAPRKMSWSGSENQELSCLNTADMDLIDDQHHSSFKINAKHLGIEVGSKEGHSRDQYFDSEEDLSKQVKMQEFLKAKESLSLRRKNLLKQSRYAKQKPFLRRETIECYPSFLLKRTDSEESDEVPVFHSATEGENNSREQTNAARTAGQMNGIDNFSPPAASTPRKQKLYQKSSSLETEFPSSLYQSAEPFQLEERDKVGENGSSHKRISVSDHFPEASHEYLNTSAQSEPMTGTREDYTLSEVEDIENTKRSLALHKKQLLGSMTGDNQGEKKTSGEMTSRIRYRQMREGMREKSCRWRSLSASRQY